MRDTTSTLALPSMTAVAFGDSPARMLYLSDSRTSEGGSMDSRVSARIALETRKRGDRQLKKIGATPSQLINAAYRYVIATGELPHTGKPLHAGEGGLAIEEAHRLFAERIEQTTCKVDSDYFAGRSDDEILEQELRARHEALA